MNDGYGDADEVSFAAMATTPDFLGSLLSRVRKWTHTMDGYQETREVEKQSMKEDD